MGFSCLHFHARCILALGPSWTSLVLIFVYVSPFALMTFFFLMALWAPSIPLFINVIPYGMT